MKDAKIKVPKEKWPEIPKGWRRLRPGTVIRATDKNWGLSTGRVVHRAWRPAWYPGAKVCSGLYGIHIRRIAKKPAKKAQFTNRIPTITVEKLRLIARKTKPPASWHRGKDDPSKPAPKRKGTEHNLRKKTKR